MKPSLYQQRKIAMLKKRAFSLYKQGYSTRDIGIILLPKRTHSWVAKAIKELSTGDST